MGSYRFSCPPIYPWISWIWTLCPGRRKAAWDRARGTRGSIIRLRKTPAADFLYTPPLQHPKTCRCLFTWRGSGGWDPPELSRDTRIFTSQIPGIPSRQAVWITVRLFGVFFKKKPQGIVKIAWKRARRLLAQHNSLKLVRKLEYPRAYPFWKSREYVERQCRVRPWLMQHCDWWCAIWFSWKKNSILRSNTLYATLGIANRVEIRRFAQRILERYTALILIRLCSSMFCQKSLIRYRFHIRNS